MRMKALTASSDDTDESLMRLIQQGSHQAFAFLVRRHTDRFYASAFRMCGNQSEAEDMVQDAFLKIWNRPDLWKDDRGAKFTTWFYRILLNQNTDRLRKHRNVTDDNSMLPSIADSNPTPEKQAVLNEEQRLLEEALAALPERQRTALTLCFYEGLSNADAAGVMGVKVKALESLLMRAKAGLRDFINRPANNLEKGERYAAR
ncbi:MAG: RNA polymerase sigma factor [Micavibrio sp.]